MSQIPETNPELASKGPLPDGWVTEYSPQWNAWFYVDTKAENPQSLWTHPLDKNVNPPPANTAEPHDGHSSTQTAPTDHPTNPDTRPLPPGWISQYNPDHKAFFYVNEGAADPGSTVTWTHPAESQPPATDLKSPGTSATHADTTGTSMPTPVPTGESTKAASTDPAAGVPPTVPAGWKAEFDANYKAWYYINTNDPSAGPTWTLPADTHAAIPPAGHQAGATPPIATQSSYTGTSPKKTAEPLPSTEVPATPGGTMPNPAGGQKENPDKRPLPLGWITKFDENYNVWYYVDTTKPGNVATWEHPAEKAGTPGAPVTPGVGGTPVGYNAGGAPPPYQQDGGQAPPHTGGKGIEGLLGGSAGKMVGGLFGAKGRAQMDMFADKLAPEVNKLKGKFAGGSSSGHAQGQGQYGAPPTGAPGQYGPPPAHGQYGAPTTPGQGSYSSPPPPSQGPHVSPPAPGQGVPGAHSPAPGQGPPPGQYPPAPGAGPAGAPGQYGAPPAHGQHGAPTTPGQAPYGSPPAPSQPPHGSPPPGQPPYGSPAPPGQGQYGAPGAHSSAPGQGPPPGQYAPAPGAGYGAPPGQPPHGQGGSTGPGGLGGLAGTFGKFGLGKK